MYSKTIENKRDSVLWYDNGLYDFKFVGLSHNTVRGAAGGAVLCADNDDIKDGKIDIVNTIIRECKEELNISLQDKNQVDNYGIKYICLPSDEVHTYIVFAKGELKMTKAQMQEYYSQYLKYLEDSNLEVEFSKIHFVKKGRTTQELEKFKNPKRHYLKSLLDIDSKTKEMEPLER